MVREYPKSFATLDEAMRELKRLQEKRIAQEREPAPLGGAREGFPRPHGQRCRPSHFKSRNITAPK